MIKATRAFSNATDRRSKAVGQLVNVVFTELENTEPPVEE